MESISTYGLYSMLMSSANQAQTSLATATEQEASGLVGMTFADLGSSAGRLLNLQSEVSQAQTWSSNATTAGDRVTSTYNAVGNMISELTTLRTALSAAISNTASATSADTTLSSNASGILQDMASQLNTQLDGRYLFAGSQTDTKPVDLTSYPATSPPSATTVDTSYYKGDDAQTSVRVSGEETVSYGVTADNSAFEQALRAASMAATADPTNGTTLQSAYDLASKALTALSTVQADLSNSASRLSDASTQQTTFISLLGTMTSNIESVDTSQAASNVASYKALLEASYSAVSTVLKTRLTSYL